MTNNAPSETLPPQRVDRHYAALAASYNRWWGQDEQYVTWRATQLITALHLTDATTLADVGCGTGLYAARIAGLSPSTTIYCIDPSQEMLDEVKKDPRLITIRARASEVADALQQHGVDHVDRILVSAALHHFDNPAADLAGLTDVLGARGRIVVALVRAPVGVPLFAAARYAYGNASSQIDSYVTSLHARGLDVHTELMAYHLTVPCDVLEEMVRSRYATPLLMFNDDEIEAGIEEMRAVRPPSGMYHFDYVEELLIADRPD
jgi:ubiquinone/menaquinone biosynthesis C-methylase UbiE